MRIIEVLLGSESVSLPDLLDRMRLYYAELKFPERAFVRDLVGLINLSAIGYGDDHVTLDLDWPQKFSESELLDRNELMPPASSAGLPAMADLSRLMGRQPRRTP